MSNVVFAVDCVWTEFDFKDCSNPCGPGTWVGRRSILTPAKYGGQNCSGPSEVTDDCNSDPEGGKRSSFNECN